MSKLSLCVRRQVNAGGRRPVEAEVEVACPVSFFFQAEDGIRDLTVTGVQTCALPISDPGAQSDSHVCSPQVEFGSRAGRPARPHCFYQSRLRFAEAGKAEERGRSGTDRKRVV